MNKNADAFRTISEVAEELDLPQHVLRFWETRFPQIKPLKRAGGRRYYRPRDIDVLRTIKHLLYREGYTIRGVQRVLKEQVAGAVAAMTDVAGEGGSDFSVPVARELPRLQGSPLSESERAGQSPRTAHSAAGVQPPAESRAIADRDDAASMTRKGSPWALALTTEDIGRLRAALAELVECEDILDAARRR
jgi:DNA-binding transcriptional MerR regulator